MGHGNWLVHYFRIRSSNLRCRLETHGPIWIIFKGYLVNFALYQIVNYGAHNQGGFWGDGARLGFWFDEAGLSPQITGINLFRLITESRVNAILDFSDSEKNPTVRLQIHISFRIKFRCQGSAGFRTPEGFFGIPEPEKNPGYPVSRIPGSDFSLPHTPGLCKKVRKFSIFQTIEDINVIYAALQINTVNFLSCSLSVFFLLLQPFFMMSFFFFFLVSNKMAPLPFFSLSFKDNHPLFRSRSPPQTQGKK